MLLGLIPVAQHLFLRKVVDVSVLLVGTLFYMLEALFEFVVGAAQRIVGVDSFAGSPFDEGKEHVAQLLFGMAA